jgi:predicted Na+-dependent transporter
VAGATEAAERRIFGAALILVAAVLVGLGLGAAFSPPGSTRALALPALGLQTLLTVGALPRRERSVDLRPGLILLGLHLALASLPLALVGLAIGLDDPLGFGLFLIAAAPPAALIPAYADVAEVPGVDLLVFVLIAYGLALVLTPALVYLAAGELVGLGPIALTLGAGLVAPAVLARALHPQIARIPQRVRRGVVNSSIVVICFGLGGGLLNGLDSTDFSTLTLAVVVLALVTRSAAGAALAARVAPAELKTEAPFAVAFKNIALAAAVGGSLSGPVAALPGLVAFPIESLYFLWLAQRHARGAAQP